MLHEVLAAVTLLLLCAGAASAPAQGTGKVHRGYFENILSAETSLLACADELIE